jgi:hypothetical protein
MSRAGTTWVASWLVRHPEVHVEEENYLLHAALQAHRGEAGPTRREVAERFAAMNEAGRPVFVDKSPGHPSGVADALEVFPEAKALVFYKYGPDGVYSVLHRARWRMRAMNPELARLGYPTV